MSDPIQLPKLPFQRETPDGFKNDLESSPQAQVLIMEAELMGITWEVVPFSIVVKLTYNGHVEYVCRGTPASNRVPGPFICGSKYQTRAVLAAAGLPIAKGYAVMQTDSLEDRAKIFNALQKPLVVKPSNGTHGNGVKMAISTLEEMNSWIDHLFATQEKDSDIRLGMVLVEETGQGKEYRIIATREKVVAVMKRDPASVTGDGTHTVKELIDIKNTDPMRNIDHMLYPHISVDDEMISILASQQLSLESVPMADQKVALRLVSNIMAGGDAIDVTEEIHPSVAEIAVRVVNAIPGMSLVGMDYLTTDITSDQANQEHIVIEVNSAPEYTMHDLPMFGKKRGVARTILQMLFPEWREQS